MIETEEDTNKWKDILSTWTERILLKMSLLTKTKQSTDPTQSVSKG